MLSVRDTGIGMTPEVLKRVFEPFYTTKEIGQGTGLGLSVVIGVIENHGGFIHVQSAPGAGSEFKIHLPAVPFVEVPVAPLENAPATSRGGGEVILLVDDETAILKVAGKILERNGYQPLVAQNGTEALNLLSQNPHTIRLVVTDYSMPGMNGCALAQAIQQSHPGIPVIIASGLGNTLDEEKCHQAGIREILKKPFDTATLLNTLHKVLHPDSLQ